MKSIVVVFTFLCLGTAQELEYTLRTVPLSDPVEATGSRIVGGVPTNIQRYPYAVQLQYFSGTVCGGSLLTRRHVLTAAHCFFDQNGRLQVASNFRVRAGTSNLQSGGSVAGVSTVIIHERYNSPLRDNDIAIVLMSSAFTLSNNIRTVAILPAGTQVPDGTSCMHIGWGKLYYEAISLSPVLREAQVYTVNRQQCAANYLTASQLQHEPFIVTENNLCSGLFGVGGRDACQGDSGGPLVYQGQYEDVVVGVTAWGIQCALPQFPGVNMLTSAYATWINRTIVMYNSSSQLHCAWSLLILAYLITVVFRNSL